MTDYLSHFDKKFSLMDVELVSRLSAASRTIEADFAGILKDTIVEINPVAAVRGQQQIKLNRKTNDINEKLSP